MSMSQDEQISSADEWQTEAESADDDDGDMDFELASDDLTLDVEIEEGDDEDDSELRLYFDAEDGTPVDEESVAQTTDEDAPEGSQTPRADPTETTQTRQIRITEEQLLRLLSQPGFRHIFQNSGITTRSQGQRRHVHLNDEREEEEAEEEEENNDDDDDDDDDEDAIPYFGYHTRRRHGRKAFVGDRYPKIPSDQGIALMGSGTFGNNDRCNHSACGLPLSSSGIRKRRRLERRMLDRELGLTNRGRQKVLGSLAAQDMIPSSKADMIINLEAPCYSGQFSEDGSFFFACGQDFMVRMYDTTNPYHWKFYKDARYYGGQWTITDASLSPDNKLLAYSSIRSQVCLSHTDKEASEPQMLDFSEMEGSSRRSHNYPGHFGIWSIRFSGDGREIVAGTSDRSVYVYDLGSRKSILRIQGHRDDVNAVCFGDRLSPHILYSGSDDTTLKIWDRRSLSSMRPAGSFLGHTEGLTYIDSKGDGRYVISNAKDQTCKLWDLRKMISTDDAEKIRVDDFTSNFDYRFARYDVDSHIPHNHDCSLVTFRGHRVLKTLIRCHFSPAGSTDGRYIYSGSHDGKVYIWTLDGMEASPPIDVAAATRNTRPRSDSRYSARHEFYDEEPLSGQTWKTIVRDCSWHPSAPVIAATSWNGWEHGLGTCSVHSWDGDLPKPSGVAPTPGGIIARTTASERRQMSHRDPADDIGDDGYIGRQDEDDGDEEAEYNNIRNGDAYGQVRGNWGSAPMGARLDAHLRHDARYYSSGHTATRRAATGLRTRLGGGLAAFLGGLQD